MDMDIERPCRLARTSVVRVVTKNSNKRLESVVLRTECTTLHVTVIKKSSAVAEMGDRVRAVGRKVCVGGLLCPLLGGGTGSWVPI